MIKETPKVGYQGVPEPQMAMSEVMERYAPSPGSLPESTDNSVRSSSSTGKPSGKKFAPPYYPQSDDVSGSVITRDANRIWQVAPRLNERQFRDRQRVPPTSTQQAQLKTLPVIVHLSRTLRPFNADTGEAAWEQRVINRITATHDNYLRPMQNNLHEQCSARYSLRPGESWETHSQYPRNLKAMKPITKEAIQRTRYCVLIDSTVPCDLPFDNIIPDVLVATMPLSRLPEMAEVAIAIFSSEILQKEPPPKRIIFANVMDHMACEGLLENLPQALREMSTNEAAWKKVVEVLHRVATAMERTAELLRVHLKVPALFVSPPGKLYWGGRFQPFVYMLTEVCSARSIEFYLCVPNLRVGKADLRPAAVSAHAYLAAISRLLQPVGHGGKAQLTWDDAIYYDCGMRLGTLTFDETGRRISTEATQAERENLRKYNWLVREAHPNTIKADLAAVWDQLIKWPLNREVERTIPQVQFAENTEIIKMPLGIRHIVEHEAVALTKLVQEREVTFGDWYTDHLAKVTLETTAQTLSVSFHALLTSFGLGWHMDVVADEFNRTDGQLEKLTEVHKGTTVDEVLALALALGPTKFVACPLVIVVDLVTSCGVLEFYTYLVPAQGKLTSLLKCGEILFMQNGHNYTEHLFKMRASAQHWLYSTLIYASGLFVGVDQAQPIHDPETQLPQNPGFPMPQQLTDMTLAEVEDLVPVVAPVLIPTFGPLGLLRYPTKPVSLAVHIATVSIFTYLQGSSPLNYAQMMQGTFSGEMLQAYTTIKTEQQVEEDMMGVVRAR